MFNEGIDRGGKASPVRKNRRLQDKLMPLIFVFCSLFTVIAVVGIVTMLGAKALPFMAKAGVFGFLAGREWMPTEGQFGIAPMIAGTLYVTLGALVMGVPLGLLVATYFAEIAPKKLTMIFNPLIDLLAGIPSVIYGFYGLMVIVPLIRRIFGGPGFSVLAGSIVLGVMILPTIVNVAREAMIAVPREYREGSMALGSTEWQTIWGVVYPAACSGLIAAVILGLGRAFGETMAVIMVTGNMAAFPHGLNQPVRTLTGNVVLEMGYATGDHLAALFATGFVLLLFIMVMNLFTRWLTRREDF